MKKVTNTLVLLNIVYFITFVNSSFGQENSFASSNNTLAAKLFHQIGQHSANESFIIAPLNITSSLTLLYSSSSHLTAKRIEHALDIKAPLSKFLYDFQQINKKLENSKPDNLVWDYKNSFWFSDKINLSPQFIKNNQDYFNCFLKKFDFKFLPDLSRQYINEWVNQQSDHKLDEILPASSLSTNNMLSVINFMYFESFWENEFDKDKTSFAQFLKMDRSENAVEFMNQTSPMLYFQSNTFQFLEIPFQGRSISFYVILPGQAEDILFIDKIFEEDGFKSLLTSLKKKEVHLSLPKFNLESYLDLKHTLGRLGLSNVFKRSAWFENVTDSKKFALTNMYQKNRLSVNEKGVSFTTQSNPLLSTTNDDDLVVMNVNKPFVFIIYDKEQELIVLLGRIMDIEDSAADTAKK